MEQKDSRFAVLIDADNVSPKYIKYILDEVSDQGACRTNGSTGLDRYLEKSWKKSSFALLNQSDPAVQQYERKNSTGLRDDHRCHGHPST